MNANWLALLFALGLLGYVDIVSSYRERCADYLECRLITDCGEHVERIKKLHLTNGIHHRNLLLGPVRRITCGFQGRVPKICCPVDGFGDLNNDAYATYGDNSSKTRIGLRNRSAVAMNSIGCGNFLWNKNLPPDGGPTDLFEFPWLALLLYKSLRGNRFGCGGVLISDRYVLTAAHCLHPSFELIGIRLGEYDLKNNLDCFTDDPLSPSARYCNDKSVDVGIERQIVHDGYRHLRGPSDFEARSHDIALLRLSRSVEFSDFVKPICLPGRESGQGVRVGKYLASGWGIAPNDEGPKSDLKRMFRLTLTERGACDGIYGRTLQRDVVCATAKANNVGCVGDSGGPLMALDDKGRMTVVGIYAPAGSGYCWTSSVPNTYTDVSQYSDWIAANATP